MNKQIIKSFTHHGSGNTNKLDDKMNDFISTLKSFTVTQSSAGYELGFGHLIIIVGVLKDVKN